MKSPAPFFIIFLLLLVQPVSADNGSFYWIGADSTQGVNFTGTFTNPNADTYTNSLYFSDQQTLESFQSTHEHVVSGFYYTGGDGETGADTSVTFMSGSTVVGTGIVYYSKTLDGHYDIHIFHWQDWNVSGLSAPIRINIVDSDIGFEAPSWWGNIAPSPYITGVAVLDWYKAGFGYIPVGTIGAFRTEASYDYYNAFEYISYTNFNTARFEREDLNRSKIIIEINGTEVKNETTLKLTDLYWTDSFDVWNITMENFYGDVKTKQILFDSVYLDATALIEFNQSFYTSPDNVRLDSTVVNMNPDNYYSFELWYYDDFWKVMSGSYIGGTEIDSEEDSVNITVYTSGIPLPVKIIGYVNEFDSDTGTGSYIANTGEVWYNPESLEPGQIWTDESSYNETETMIISYDTSELTNSMFIRFEPDLDAPILAYWQVLGVGLGNKSFSYYWATTTAGDYRISLYEDGSYSDSVTITVNNAPDPYCEFAYPVLNQGSNGIVSYNSLNASATIKVIDSTGDVMYSGVTQIGTYEVVFSSEEGVPGIWTVSMLHEGSYYNDTMYFNATDPFVAFSESVYSPENNPVIEIRYTLTDRNQVFTLYDAVGHVVKTFSFYNSDLKLSEYGTVQFTLEDDNEYGIDVISDMDNEIIRPGTWYVQVNTFGAVVDVDGEAVIDRAEIKYIPSGYFEYNLIAFADAMGFRGDSGHFAFAVVLIIVSMLGTMFAAGAYGYNVSGNILIMIATLEFFVFAIIGLIPPAWVAILVIVVAALVFVMYRKESS